MKHANHNFSGFGAASCTDFKKIKIITCAIQNCERVLNYHLNKYSDYATIGKVGIFSLSRSDISTKLIQL